MRLSELMASTVVDAAGQSLGPVRDVRLAEPEDGRLVLAGLVIGDGHFASAAHAWGFAEGRADGPWLLRALTARAVRQARFVPVEQVVKWGPGAIRISAHMDALPTLREAMKR